MARTNGTPPAWSTAAWFDIGYAPGRPLAVTVPDAAVLLGIPEPIAAEVAARLEPYVCDDDTRKWSLRELRRELGAVQVKAP